MIHLGTQYYRPPFPNDCYWESDIRRMAESGLNTIQLWVVWAWVEAKPGTYCFDDYDRLVELAETYGLEVVLSTIAAIHPYWIHREVPGSEMVDSFDHKVVSSNRGECHFGLTPGGCIDHPGVWARMRDFLTAVVSHYRAVSNLMGWDAWNELRWNVQADGLVCYCPYTLSRFRRWLDAKYEGLDGLNTAWQRRYQAWDEVRPGKAPDRPYTEMMAFENFITWRAVQHAYDRYDHMKALDPDHPITVHGGQPTVLHGNDRYPLATALHRGNDWDFAERIDGIGCSSFPLWGGSEMDRADFINRIDFAASARSGKRLWLSELQGGRSNIGFNVAQSVDPSSQQRWVWTGLSAGADSILFWCWRDEVFGRESTGFGLAGRDGLAEARLSAMRKTGDVLAQYGELLDAFEPVDAEVGIFFSPQSYYLYWAQEGTAQKALSGIRGYARALARQAIPYRIVEEKHLDQLEGLKLLILPRTVVMDDEVAEALVTFVRAGGMLFCESEMGSFGSNGLYRYPEDRFFADLTGVEEIGRRILEVDRVRFDWEDERYELPAHQWQTPMVWRDRGRDAQRLLMSADVGTGEILFCGTYLGDAYFARGAHQGFETFVMDLITRAGITLPVRVLSPRTHSTTFTHVRMGHSGDHTLIFVFASSPEETVELAFPEGVLGDTLTDLLSGHQVRVIDKDSEEHIVLGPTEWGISVLKGA